jgi:hypothetical protein
VEKVYGQATGGDAKLMDLGSGAGCIGYGFGEITIKAKGGGGGDGRGRGGGYGSACGLLGSGTPDKLDP